MVLAFKNLVGEPELCLCADISYGDVFTQGNLNSNPFNIVKHQTGKKKQSRHGAPVAKNFRGNKRYL